MTYRSSRPLIGGFMTGWKSAFGVGFAAVLFATVLSAQQDEPRHPVRNPTPKNTWMDWPQPTVPPARVVAVRAGRLFDSKTGQMLTKQVVLIGGERITDVGAEGRITIPAGA